MSWDSFCFSCHSYDPQRFQIYYRHRLYFTLLLYSPKSKENSVLCDQRKRRVSKSESQALRHSFPTWANYLTSPILYLWNTCSLHNTVLFGRPKCKKYVNCRHFVNCSSYINVSCYVYIPTWHFLWSKDWIFSMLASFKT